MSSKDQRVLTFTVISLLEVKIIPWNWVKRLSHNTSFQCWVTLEKVLIKSFFFPSGGILWPTLPFSLLLSSLVICHGDFFPSSDTKLNRPCSKFSRQTLVSLVLGYSSGCHLECLYSRMTFWDPSESPGSWIRLSSKSSAMVWFLSLFCKF